MPKPNTSDLNQTEFALYVGDGGESGIPPAFTLTGTGIVIRDDSTYDEYVEGLRNLKRIKDWAHSHLEMSLSEYIAWGQMRFGKEKVLANLQQLEFDMPTVTRAIDIATIPEELRHDSLNSAHYVAIARSGLPKAKKAKWAKIADEQKLTPAQLKASMAAGEVVGPDHAKNEMHGIASIHGVRQSFTIWKNRVGGLEGILKMKDPVIDEIMGELREMHDLYDQVQAARGSK